MRLSPAQQAKSAVNDKGVVYVLSNPSMINFYKIGLTRKSIDERIFTLRTTSLPTDFICIAEFSSSHALQLELFIHRNLKTNRVNSKREFFTFISDSAAVNAVTKLVERFKPRAYTEKEVAKLDVKSSIETPAQQAKSVGLKSLTQVKDITGVGLTTLINWHRDKPELFRIVLAGCVSDVKGI